MRVLPFIIGAFLLAGMSFLGTHPAYVLVFALVVISVAALILAASYAEHRSWGQHKTPVARASRGTWIIIGLSAAFIVSIPMTHWPLHLSFLLSQRSMNKLAGQIASGTKVLAPQETGVFSVAQADSHDGLVCLWTNEDMGEPVGFMQGAPHKIKADYSNYEVIVLSDNWCHVSSL